MNEIDLNGDPFFRTSSFTSYKLIERIPFKTNSKKYISCIYEKRI